MFFDDKLVLSALKYLSGETAHVCRLCFGSTETKEIAMDDGVKVKTPYCDDTVTITNMFLELGVSSEPHLPQVLCVDCATNTINGYLFRKLFQFSVNAWNNVLTRLSESLSQSEKIGPNVKSIYLMINKNDNILFTSRKNCTVRSKKTALARIKDIMKSRRNYSKIKKININKICEECGKKFSSRLCLAKHLKLHTNLENRCTMCPKNFSSKFQLQDHAERVHYPKKLPCPKCPKMFSTERVLRIHKRISHITATCKICKLQFPSVTDMRTHMNIHEPNTCPRCKKKFSTKYTFKCHVKICGVKEKKPNFFCDICKKGYRGKNGIRSHLKIFHGFGEALPCKWCGKKFDALSKLNNHIVTHTKEKNFHCDQCGGRFVSQAALVYHIRLHTGERPFPCDLCNESFLSASRRTEHKRRKHFGPTQECKVCHVKFVTGHQLRKHVQRHYNPHSKLYINDDGP
ncbi:uncharacterized protein [Epargyreus clarus]|uniref:uncharacterized protein n=1 Tax=Epargyreus clarus TaxID=520877 RepID=UPI003C2FB082